MNSFQPTIVANLEVRQILHWVAVQYVISRQALAPHDHQHPVFAFFNETESTGKDRSALREWRRPVESTFRYCIEQVKHLKSKTVKSGSKQHSFRGHTFLPHKLRYTIP